MKLSLLPSAFLLSLLLSAFSHASPVTVGFSATFDQHVIGVDEFSTPPWIYEDGFSQVNFNGSFTFDSEIVSLSSNTTSAYATSYTAFGDPTFSFPTAIETALDMPSAITPSLDGSYSGISYRQNLQVASGQSGTGLVQINERKFDVLEYSDGSYDFYSRSIVIEASKFATITTVQEAATPIDLLGFLNYIQAEIDTQRQRKFYVSAGTDFCIDQDNCVLRDAAVYHGTIVLTGITTVPIPATAWLFGSSLIGLLLIRRKS